MQDRSGSISASRTISSALVIAGMAYVLSRKNFEQRKRTR